MAWISVHEQVLGGKLRNLAKEIGCSQNEALGMLVRLWLWGINNATKDGMIEGADQEDLADVLNIGIDKRYTSLSAVYAMIQTRWIDILDGGLYIHDWTEWQKQWYKALEARERDAERKRAERVAKSVFVQDSPAPSVPSDQEQPPTTSKPVKKLETEYSPEFEEFWKSYPRAVGKKEAYAKFLTRLKEKKWTADQIVQAAKNYADECKKRRTDPQYIKHPKTFLSDKEPFADYVFQVDQQSFIDDDDPYKEWGI